MNAKFHFRTSEEIVGVKRNTAITGKGYISCQLSLVSLVAKDRKQNGKLLAPIEGESRGRRLGTTGCRGPSRK